MAEKESKAKISKDEQIGFHKGSIATLAKERQELLRIVSIVEQLMQVHIGELQKLGVDLTKEVEQEKQKDEKKKPKKPIEDIV
jgi:hypothetical protein